MIFNLKSDIATEVENFNFLTSGLKKILSSSACLSRLEMGLNTVCTVEIDGNTICLLHVFLFQRKNKTQLSLRRRASEVTDDVS